MRRRRILASAFTSWLCVSLTVRSRVPTHWPRPSGPVRPIDFRWWWYNGFFKKSLFSAYSKVLQIKMEQQYITSIINLVCCSWCLACIFFFFKPTTTSFYNGGQCGGGKKKKKGFPAAWEFFLCSTASVHQAERPSGWVAWASHGGKDPFTEFSSLLKITYLQSLGPHLPGAAKHRHIRLWESHRSVQKTHVKAQKKKKKKKKKHCWIEPTHV